jgi:centrosomal protein CEP76
MTRDAERRVTFWESLTNQRFPLDGPTDHPYVTLACVFSNHSFYANVQPSTQLDRTSLELADPTLWRAMDSALLRGLTPVPCAPLRPSSLRDPSDVALAAEAALRARVDEHRQTLGLRFPGVVWDDALSHLLAPALYSYEAERIGGYPIGQAFFADAIKRAVPGGHTFKGLPLHLTTIDPLAIFDAWQRHETASDILATRTSKGMLALRLRVFPLADEVVSVWAMLAIAYRPEA